MEKEGKGKFDSVYSNKVNAGKRRTYFFDVKQTRGNDYFVTLTESTRKANQEGFERHKIFLYKEDFNSFLAGLEDVINHIKTELMPDFDYDYYDKKEQEYKEKEFKEKELTGDDHMEDNDKDDDIAW